MEFSIPIRFTGTVTLNIQNAHSKEEAIAIAREAAKDMDFESCGLEGVEWQIDAGV